MNLSSKKCTFLNIKNNIRSVHVAHNALYLALCICPCFSSHNNIVILQLSSEGLTLMVPVQFAVHGQILIIGLDTAEVHKGSIDSTTEIHQHIVVLFLLL